jgi:hypothetical protein
VTEAEWNLCSDASAMLKLLHRLTGQRKFRLIACACARLCWGGIVEQDYLQAVEVAERCADDLAEREDLREAAGKIWDLSWGEVRGDSHANAAAAATVEDFAGIAAEKAVACFPNEAPGLIREIIGNPFRRGEPEPLWQVAKNSQLTAIAQRAYETNRFDDLPRLAELLHAAGCRDDDLLVHLRLRTSHFRGCWALDAVLGKSQGNELVSDNDWLNETHPFYMLEWWRYFHGEPSTRKQRLLACASCRLVWHLFTDSGLREAIESAESFADGGVAECELRRLHEQAHALGLARGEPLSTMSSDVPGRQTVVDSWRVAHAAAECAQTDNLLFGNAMHYVAEDGGRGRDTEDARQAALVREILGDSTRPIEFDPRWLTSTVIDLARTIYVDRAFERLPILADALMDAGCDSDEIINHCRSEGPHVLGCWLVDMILGNK